MIGLAQVSLGAEKPNIVMVLVKYLDSAVRLPFQAHPTVEFSRRHLNAESGKTEAYYILSTRPEVTEPYIYLGFQHPPTRAELRRMIVEQDIVAMEKCFDKIPVKPGDEDGGGLSAFVVFSMMGFYPVTPGLPIYDVGSPVFEKTVITLPNGKTFSIIAKGVSRENQYVQSIRLNGKPLDQVWFRHADLVNGGTLELIMGDTPNRTLGAEPSAYPPASLNSDPAAFRP